MRHATWQQLSHEPRAAINAIVAIRRMHLIAKIKTHSHTHTHTKTWSKKQTAKHTKTKTSEHNKIWKQRSRRNRRTNTKSQSPRTTQGGEQDLPPPHKVATQMHVTRQSAEGRGARMPARESTRVNEASKLLRARSLAKSCKILHGTSHRCPMRGRYRGERGEEGEQLHTCALNCMCLGVGTPRNEKQSEPNQNRSQLNTPQLESRERDRETPHSMLAS